MKHIWISVVLITMKIGIFDLNAQRRPQIITNPGLVSPSTTEIDTSYNESDTIVKKTGFFSLFKGDPGKAALYSLVIPGGGQIYNKRWWKAPIAWAIDGTLFYTLCTNRNNYKVAQLDLQNEIAMNGTNVSRLRERRDYFRKWSEYGVIFLFVGHLVTVSDAYVDRLMMDFDISDDLSWDKHTRGAPIFNSPQIQLGINFPLNVKNGDYNPKIFVSGL